MKKFVQPFLYFVVTLLIVYSCTDDKENIEVITFEAPELISPKNNSTLESLDVLLEWNHAVCINKESVVYDIYLAVSGEPIALISANQSDTAFFVTNLDYNTLYVWKIIAKCPNEEDVESTLGRFSVNERPDISGLSGEVKDIENNTYKWVGIGKQAWLAANLTATRYADGSAINLVTDNSDWSVLSNTDSDKAYCYYNNDENSEYGVLYTYAAATNGTAFTNENKQGVCPDGWHVPSITEWYQLRDYINDNGYNDPATVLKSTSGWNDASGENGNGTDIFGFTALPGGIRSPENGAFNWAGDGGYWWSSTDPEDELVYCITFDNASGDFAQTTLTKSTGVSIRCVRESEFTDAE